MKNGRYNKILQLISRAFLLAKQLGFNNLLQPGLIKEMIIANALKHEIIKSKHGADAHAPHNPKIHYEYLSCLEGGSGQMDRMFSRPPEKRKNSLDRITRNETIFLAIFQKENQVHLKRIYAISPEIFLKETERQLDVSINEISHIGISEKWAEKNGKIVYP